MKTKLSDKLERCREILKEKGSAAVAFSGGVDSSLLLAVAADCLGSENVKAVTISGPAMLADELKLAEKIAASLGVEQITININPLDSEEFAQNTELRCYHCKKLILKAISDIAASKKLNCVTTGSNADDIGDYRPGSRAEDEFGIVRPLKDAQITKAEVRELAKQFNLPNFNAPSAACLVSRIPYHEEISTERLNRIAQAEIFLKSLGFGQLRVRDHGEIARIEVMADELEKLLAQREQITEKLKSLGYLYVSADLNSFRSGSMNDSIQKG